MSHPTETSDLLKVDRVEKNAEFLVAAYKELASKNEKLERALQKTKAREAALEYRISSLEYRNEAIDNDIEATHRSNNKAGQQDYTTRFEDRFVEQLIQHVKDKASKANSSVSLGEYQRLHSVYLAIKAENNNLRTGSCWEISCICSSPER